MHFRCDFFRSTKDWLLTDGRRTRWAREEWQNISSWYHKLLQISVTNLRHCSGSSAKNNKHGKIFASTHTSPRPVAACCALHFFDLNRLTENWFMRALIKLSRVCHTRWGSEVFKTTENSAHIWENKLRSRDSLKDFFSSSKHRWPRWTLINFSTQLKVWWTLQRMWWDFCFMLFKSLSWVTSQHNNNKPDVRSTRQERRETQAEEKRRIIINSSRFRNQQQLSVRTNGRRHLSCEFGHFLSSFSRLDDRNKNLNLNTQSTWQMRGGGEDEEKKRARNDDDADADDGDTTNCWRAEEETKEVKV